MIDEVLIQYLKAICIEQRWLTADRIEEVLNADLAARADHAIIATKNPHLAGPFIVLPRKYVEQPRGAASVLLKVPLWDWTLTWLDLPVDLRSYTSPASQYWPEVTRQAALFGSEKDRLLFTLKWMT